MTTQTQTQAAEPFWRTALNLVTQVATVAAMVFVANAVEDRPQRGDVFVRAHLRTYRRF